MPQPERVDARWSLHSGRQATAVAAHGQRARSSWRRRAAGDPSVCLAGTGLCANPVQARLQDGGFPQSSHVGPDPEEASDVSLTVSQIFCARGDRADKGLGLWLLQEPRGCRGQSDIQPDSPPADGSGDLVPGPVGHSLGGHRWKVPGGQGGRPSPPPPPPWPGPESHQAHAGGGREREAHGWADPQDWLSALALGGCEVGAPTWEEMATQGRRSRAPSPRDRRPGLPHMGKPLLKLG